VEIKGNKTYVPDVSKGLREALISAYPDAFHDPAIVNLIHYLMFEPCSFRDNLIPLDGNTLARLRGKVKKHKSRNLRGQDSHKAFLDRFTAAMNWGGFRLNWFNAYRFEQYGTKYPRMALVNRDWDETVQKALEYERKHYDSLEKRIHLYSGEKISARSLTSFEIGPQGIAEHRYESVNALVDHLNALPTNYFRSQIRRGATGAFMWAQNKNVITAREYCFRLLRSLSRFPVPQYQTKDGYRIFASGNNLQSMPSELRKILLPDCIELDLSAAQLGIIAKIWSLEPLKKEIEKGEIWNTILEIVGFPIDSKPHKRILKKLIYAFCNGMRYRYLALAVMKEAIHQDVYISTSESKKVVEDLFSSKLFEGIKIARSDTFDRLLKEGELNDYYGFTHSAVDPKDDKVTWKLCKTVFSKVISSYEYALLEDVVVLMLQEQEKAKPQYQIVLWQHDGFSIRVTQKDRKPSVVKKLQSVVSNKASSMGIPTRLEVN
jgi:hypothetical protein